MTHRMLSSDYQRIPNRVVSACCHWNSSHAVRKHAAAGTKEMINPCLTYLHVISLVAHRRRAGHRRAGLRQAHRRSAAGSPCVAQQTHTHVVEDSCGSSGGGGQDRARGAEERQGAQGEMGERTGEGRAEQKRETTVPAASDCPIAHSAPLPLTHCTGSAGSEALVGGGSADSPAGKKVRKKAEKYTGPLPPPGWRHRTAVPTSQQS